VQTTYNRSLPIPLKDYLIKTLYDRNEQHIIRFRSISKSESAFDYISTTYALRKIKTVDMFNKIPQKNL